MHLVKMLHVLTGIFISLCFACAKGSYDKKQREPVPTASSDIEQEENAPAEESYIPSSGVLAGDDSFPTEEGVEWIDPKSEEYKKIVADWGLSLAILTPGQKILNAAKKYLDLPFEFGSPLSHKESFDCSKLMYFAVKEAGYGKLPRTARGQVSYLKGRSTSVVKKNLPKKLGGLQKGDLIYWHLNDDRVPPGIASHSTIYAGKDSKGHLLMQASQTYGVALTRLYGSFLDEKKIVATFRIIKKLN